MLLSEYHQRDDCLPPLALLPLRHGKILRKRKEAMKQDDHPQQNNEEEHHPRLSLPRLVRRQQQQSKNDKNQYDSQFITVGRMELLSCLYDACGCDSNRYSTKDKCLDCRRMPPHLLSRQLLAMDTYTHRLYVRSTTGERSYASVRVRDQNGVVLYDDDEDGMYAPVMMKRNGSGGGRIEWRDTGWVVTAGQLISIKTESGAALLEFQFVSLIDMSLVNHDIDKDIMRQLIPTSSSSTMMQPTIEDTVSLWFCPLGQDMPRHRIRTLSQQVTDHKGNVRVETDPWKATTWIISGLNGVTMQKIATLLQQKSEASVEKTLDSNFVQCLLPKWVSSAIVKGDFSSTSRPDFWSGYMSKKKKKRKRSSRDDTGGAAISSSNKVRYPIRRHNRALSECFKRLSKLYQSSPIFPEDIWKAYSFHKVAGRLSHLPFEIDEETPRSTISAVPTFGPSVVSMIHEYCKNNTSGEHQELPRVTYLKADKERVDMKAIMGIWGVGRATALGLVQQGYRTIDDIRKGIADEKLALSRRQLIGVECYEDILEEIPRSEVKQIGDLVINTFRELLSEHEVEGTIMGSFRRGKDKSGDVDVLLTLKDFPDSVPNMALQRLIHQLTQDGHIAHHLTLLPGLDSDIEMRRPRFSAAQDSEDDERRSSYSYMGVFNSPVHVGKKRRVDIKIYPYLQKSFASLYFTGSAQFNRSMRLWATNKMGLKLGDRGITEMETGNKTDFICTSEEDVFKCLQLKFVPPCERQYFDDVEPILPTKTA